MATKRAEPPKETVDKKEAAPKETAGATPRESEVHKLPSKVWDGDVTIMEMTTQEESLMSRQKKLRDGSAILQVLEACTKEDIPLDDILLPDRYYLMVQIRRISYKDQYPFKARCPGCGETFPAEVDLSKLPCSTLEKDPDYIYELKLPRSGRKIQWKHLRGKDEKYLLMARKSPDDNALVPVSLNLHCVSIDGNKNYDATFFDTLGSLDAMSFRDHILDNGCGLDTMLALECPSCEYDFDLDMPINADFFWPSAAKKSGTPSSTSCVVARPRQS